MIWYASSLDCFTTEVRNDNVVGRITGFNPGYPGSSRPVTQTGTKSNSGQLYLVGISLPNCENYVNFATYVAKNNLTPSSEAEVEDPCSAAKGKWG
jgi:hypothetical protein